MSAPPRLPPQQSGVIDIRSRLRRARIHRLLAKILDAHQALAGDVLAGDDHDEQRQLLIESVLSGEPLGAAAAGMVLRLPAGIEVSEVSALDRAAAATIVFLGFLQQPIAARTDERAQSLLGGAPAKGGLYPTLHSKPREARMLLTELLWQLIYGVGFADQALALLYRGLGALDHGETVPFLAPRRGEWRGAYSLVQYKLDAVKFAYFLHGRGQSLRAAQAAVAEAFGASRSTIKKWAGSVAPFFSGGEAADIWQIAQAAGALAAGRASITADGLLVDGILRATVDSVRLRLEALDIAELGGRYRAELERVGRGQKRRCRVGTKTRAKSTHSEKRNFDRLRSGRARGASKPSSRSRAPPR